MPLWFDVVAHLLFACWDFIAGPLAEVFRALLGPTATGFAVYFAWRKIGNKIEALYTSSAGGLSARRISSITLTNRKDKPVSVFEIYAVLGDGVHAPVEKFEPPLILKPLESLHIEIEPFSAYALGTQEYIAKLDPKNVQLFVVSQDKVIRCKLNSSPWFALSGKEDTLTVLRKLSHRFNDRVYTNNAKFGITYKLDGQGQTAFVLHSGVITGDWHFRTNMLGHDDIQSEKSVYNALEALGLKAYVGWFAVDTLPPLTLERPNDE